MMEQEKEVQIEKAVEWHELARDGSISWHTVALWLFFLRMAWFNEHLYASGESRQMVVKSEEIQVDLLRMKVGTRIKLNCRMGRCQDTIMEMHSELFANENEKYVQIGVGIVTMVFIERSQGVPKKTKAPGILIKLSKELAPPDFREKSKKFREQTLKNDRPHWICPQFFRYSDEDSNLHVNHGSYFRIFFDSKLAAIRAYLHEKPFGNRLIVEKPPPEVVELAHYDVTSFSVFFVKEVRVMDGRSFYVIVQANAPEKALELFLCSKENDVDKIYTYARMELNLTRKLSTAHI